MSDPPESFGELSPESPSPPSLTATGSPCPCGLTTLVGPFLALPESLLSASPPLGSATLSESLVAS